MLNAAMFKVILVAVGVAGAGFAGWWVVGLIGENAALVGAPNHLKEQSL